MFTVYKIISKTTGRAYVGSSQDTTQRLRNHLQHLRKNCHSNTNLQEHYNLYGVEDLSLSKCSTHKTRTEAMTEEQRQIELEGENAMNLHPACFAITLVKDGVTKSWATYCDCARELNVHDARIHEIVKGKTVSVHGWELPVPVRKIEKRSKYHKHRWLVKNTATEQVEVVISQAEFIAKYPELRYGNVSSLLNGHISMYKDWVVLVKEDLAEPIRMKNGRRSIPISLLSPTNKVMNFESKRKACEAMGIPSQWTTLRALEMGQRKDIKGWKLAAGVAVKQAA